MNCENCSICLSNMGKVNVCVLECGHQFHTTCIIKCTNNKCPLCRDLILKEEEVKVEVEAENNYNYDEEDLDNFIQSILSEPITNDSNVRISHPWYPSRQNLLGSIGLLRSLGKTQLNDIFIKQFLIKLEEKNYTRAYRIRCIYYKATMLLFRILGYSYELDYTLSSISGDIVKQMDELIGGKIFPSEKQNIEGRVICFMPDEEDYKKYIHFTQGDWMSHSQFGYVVLSELVKLRS
jgi:Ring finger domain